MVQPEDVTSLILVYFSAWTRDLWTDEPSWQNRHSPWAQKDEMGAAVEMVVRHPWLKGHEFEQTPGDSEGQGSLPCCSSWGRKESDTTQWLNNSSMSPEAWVFYLQVGPNYICQMFNPPAIDATKGLQCGITPPEDQSASSWQVDYMKPLPPWRWQKSFPTGITTRSGYEFGFPLTGLSIAAWTKCLEVIMIIKEFHIALHQQTQFTAKSWDSGHVTLDILIYCIQHYLQTTSLIEHWNDHLTKATA